MNETTKEIMKIASGKDGIIEARMVDEKMDVSIIGTTEAKLSLALLTIFKLAESEKVNFKDYTEILNEYYDEMSNIARCI